MTYKNKIFRSYLIIYFLLSLSAAFAGTVIEAPVLGGDENDRLIFSIKNAELIRNEPNVPLLALTFDIKNQTKHRKIDLSNEIELTLKDDFHNKYNKLERPKWYSGPTVVLNDNYPSLYPEEGITETVFFESPISIAGEITLEIDTKDTELRETAMLKFPTKDIKNFLPKQERYIPKDDDLKIEYPKSGHVKAAPGDHVHMNIKLSPYVSTPSKIYILSPNYIFEDKDLKYGYDVLIPASQESGPFSIVVMVEWEEETGKRYISKSLTFDVVNPNVQKEDGLQL